MGTVDWIYKNEIFVEEKIGDNCGFVYLITNNNNNKKYIGKKLFHFSKSKTVKGKKKRYKIQSDWKDYYGSNTKLQDDVKMHGVDSFKREILHLCKTKGQCNYLEAKEQFNPIEQDISFQRISIAAPAGMLGIVLDNPHLDLPVVYAIKETSALHGKIRVGDLLLSVDEVECRGMSAHQISTFLSSRSQNPVRTLVLARGTPAGSGTTAV